MTANAQYGLARDWWWCHRHSKRIISIEEQEWQKAERKSRKSYDNNHLMSMKWVQRERRSHAFHFSLRTSRLHSLFLALAKQLEAKPPFDVAGVLSIRIPYPLRMSKVKMLRNKMALCIHEAQEPLQGQWADIMQPSSLANVEILFHQFYSFELFTRNLFKS